MTPISDPLFNVTCYAVAGDLIVYSGEAYQTRRTDREPSTDTGLGTRPVNALTTARGASRVQPVRGGNTIVLVGSAGNTLRRM